MLLLRKCRQSVARAPALLLLRRGIAKTANMEKIYELLREQGMLREGTIEPQAVDLLISMQEQDIVDWYSLRSNALLECYRSATNFAQVQRIAVTNVVCRSLQFTLAKKQGTISVKGDRGLRRQLLEFDVDLEDEMRLQDGEDETDYFNRVLNCSCGYNQRHEPAIRCRSWRNEVFLFLVDPVEVPATVTQRKDRLKFPERSRDRCREYLGRSSRTLQHNARTTPAPSQRISEIFRTRGHSDRAL